MNDEATRSGDWLAGLMAGREALLAQAVRGPDRARQLRLLGVLLIAPFVLAPALMQAAVPAYGAAMAVAALCAVAATNWLIAYSILSGGRDEAGIPVAIASATLVIAAVVAPLGGLGSPVALLLLAIPAEAWWVSRSRRDAGLATGAALLAGLAVAVAAGQVAPVSSWYWLTPLAYLATVAVRWLSVNEQALLRGPLPVSPGLPEDQLDAVVVRLSRTGEVDAASHQAMRLLRVEPELLLGTGLFERVHVGDRVAYLCAVDDVRETGQARRVDLRIRLPHVPGTDIAGGYELFEAEIVHGPGTNLLAILRDAGRIGRLKDELARAVEQAGATEIAKGRFLATVSHELRTPLNAIIGFSDMLLHPEISGALAPKQAEHVDLIRQAGNHLLSVVNSILDVSKIESGSYQITVEPFDLKPSVDLCCAMLQPQAAAKHVTLQARLPQGLGDALADPRAVQQILLNLVSNAVKFTPEGGSVTVNASRRDGMIRLFVNDTGIGISADDLARLGNPFVQVQNDYTRQFQGTGLGLSLVKGLVRLHGGTMSIESAPGLGTTVTIGLPAAKGEASAVEDFDKTGGRDGNALRKIA